MKRVPFRELQKGEIYVIYSHNARGNKGVITFKVSKLKDDSDYDLKIFGYVLQVVSRIIDHKEGTSELVLDAPKGEGHFKLSKVLDVTEDFGFYELTQDELNRILIEQI